MLVSDKQLIGKQSYSNQRTAIMEKRTEQFAASTESQVSEKQVSKSNLNEIAAIYEKVVRIILIWLHMQSLWQEQQQ